MVRWPEGIAIAIAIITAAIPRPEPASTFGYMHRHGQGCRAPRSSTAIPAEGLAETNRRPPQ
ncbi:MAG: hypothetical protein ABGY24_13715, partial [bacterium]